MIRGDGSQAALQASRHSLGWLLFGNITGLWLSWLLLHPASGTGEWSYGRWVPVHLNVQLYGWTALPLVAWLLVIYQVDLGRHRAWAPATVWAWSAALAAGVLHWLGGGSSGKIFLDWKTGSLAALILAQCGLWLLLFRSWLDRAAAWTASGRRFRLAGLVVLALVPPALAAASSPSVYPPVDRTTGGPSGASLLGSTLSVVALMWLLPRALGLPMSRPRIGFAPMCFGAGIVVFVLTERAGGTHFDWWQLLAMTMLLPWIVLLPRDWAAFDWPAAGRPWRRAMFFWWGFLVLSGLAMYAPGVLDKLKFTQGLVAHSHLAMSGFTTAFGAHLLVMLTGRSVGGKRSVAIWNIAVLGMVVALAIGGWLEGKTPRWMAEEPVWRTGVLLARALCGVVLTTVAAVWYLRFHKYP